MYMNLDIRSLSMRWNGNATYISLLLTLLFKPQKDIPADIGNAVLANPTRCGPLLPFT